MDWTAFNQVQLHRLLARLREHDRFYAQVEAFLKAYGFGPDDPLAVEAAASRRQAQGFIETATARLHALHFAAHRPGVDPWKTHGLAASLRPDFAARGITDRPVTEQHARRD